MEIWVYRITSSESSRLRHYSDDESLEGAVNFEKKGKQPQISIACRWRKKCENALNCIKCPIKRGVHIIRGGWLWVLQACHGILLMQNFCLWEAQISRGEWTNIFDGEAVARIELIQLL